MPKNYDQINRARSALNTKLNIRPPAMQMDWRLQAGLKFVVTSKHFQNGNMKLKCTATISRIYTMSNEEMVFGGRQQTSGLHISENMSRMMLLRVFVDGTKEKSIR
ncbi:uncharacterized protein CEXT_494951 [Caerostris extrusa]|uniref:Uncharacterized protein n=1 Tax=Caerostris extrusa TaxID=172846 RepID=A0AAV4M9H1_CAEEX|nr:uncharacterized protein CEXT_494951 [Caerostris extrusa]